MTQWDRIALLSLVDATRKWADDTSIGDTQKQQLQKLVDHYSKLTQSINATPGHVIALQAEVSRIFSQIENGE